MFDLLAKINTPPEPFTFYTAADLWTDTHTSEQMLKFHLNGDIDISSRNMVFIDRSVAWIISHFNIGSGIKIADFGCGPGLYTTKLARTMADVTGIDFSPRSIAYARESAAKEGLSINYINRNYLDFETTEKFDLIMMIMCDFCALSLDQRKQMLRKFRELLKPDGAILLDVYSMAAFAVREEKAVYEANLLDGFWSAKPYYGFLNTFIYEKEKVVLDQYAIIAAAGTRMVYNWLQYFSPEDLAGEFRENGLVVTEYYSDVMGTPFAQESAEFSIVARKWE
jgi:2-polyprenyl-3-methyl-5-hydroxy-6-metoxy-1,4-benzoquinol methylase